MFASVLRNSKLSIKYKVLMCCFGKLKNLVSYSSGTESRGVPHVLKLGAGQPEGPTPASVLTFQLQRAPWQKRMLKLESVY